MADELNTPAHRYYQPRYNVALAVEDISNQYIYDSGIRKIDARMGEVDIREPLFALSEPGVWYDPSDVANLNWRRNLLTWTEQFDNAAWVKDGSTVSANSTAAPDVATTADTVTATATSSVHSVRSAQQTIVSGANNAFSVYIKKNTSRYVWLSLQGVTIAEYATAVFDLDGGTSSATQTAVGSTSGTIVSTSMTSVGSGWYRLTIVASLLETGCFPFIGLATAATGNTFGAYGTISFSAVGTESVFIWGAQLELGTSATEYQRITDVNTEVRERFPTATLFQDTAGTTPVTTPGQTVALALDKSKGLTLGPELVTNGDFSVDTDWTKTSATISDGQATLQANGSVSQSVIPLETGRWFQITFTVVSTAGAVIVFCGTTSSGDARYAGQFSAGTRTILLQSAGITDYIRFNSNAVGVSVIDNISVKELPGTHATQATAASRPTYGVVPLGGRRNLLTFSEDFRNTAAAGGETRPWINTSVTITPDFDGNADRYVGTGTTTVSYQPVAVSAGQTRTFSVEVKNNSGTAFSGLRIHDATNSVDIAASQNLFASINNTTYTRLSVTYTVPAGCSSVRVYPVSTTGVGTSVDILIRNAQDELGSTATNYQRVGSQFDVTEAGVQSLGYLSFDGVDDFLVTPTITPNTDKVQVFAGVRKLSDAASQSIAEMSTSYATSNGVFAVIASASNAGNRQTWFWGSKGTVSSENIPTGYASPISSVLSGIGDIGADVSRLRVNGSQVAETLTDQGTGNYLAYPMYIGRRAGTSLPFNGNIFSLIVRFGANLDAATISNTETWVNGKTGAY